MLERAAVRVAVTGSAGFLGRHIVERLQGARHEVVGLDLPAWDICGPWPYDRAPWLPVDTTAIVHCAAVPDVRGLDEDRTWDVNVNGTRRLLRNLHASCRTVLFISSACVFGHDTDGRPLAPVSLYGASKLAGEALCSAWAAAAPGRRWAALRPVAMYGRGYARGHVRDFVEGYRRDGKVTALDDGSQRKEGVHAVDVANMIQALLHSEGMSGAWDIVGEPWGWQDTAREMGIDVEPGTSRAGFAGDPIRSRHAPLEVVHTHAFEGTEGQRFVAAPNTVRRGVREALESLGWVRP